jgi:Tol biopolymer transport system component
LWHVAGVVAVVAIGGAAAYLWLSREPAESRVVRSVVPPPAGASFTLSGTVVPSVTLTLSPDGRRLAFLADRPGEVARLWIRQLDSMEPTPLAGTEGATYPFWSPDGQSLAFFAGGSLKRIEIDGGTPLTLVEKTDGRGGSWSREGFILFGSSEGPIHQVSAAGGPARAVTTLDDTQQETWHRFPQFLPDEKHFLYLARGANVRTLFAGSVDDPSLKAPILETNVRSAFAQPGYLLYVTEGTLMARRFDVRRLALAGQPVEVARRVATSSANDAAFAVSDAGVLVYSERVNAPGQLTWFDRVGRPLGTLGPVDEFLGVRLSPDARTIAVTRVDLTLNMPDIWMLDVDRAVFSRFTFDPWLDLSPIWSPDGDRVLFSSSRLGRLQIFHRPAKGGVVEEPLARTAFSVFPDEAIPDGRSVIYSTDSSTGRYDIELLRLTDLQSTALVATRFNESQARLSPDGRWMAYCSDETGRDEIFVREFSGTTVSVQVSSQGASEPAWRGDGKELYFLSPDDSIMSVRLNPAGSRIEASAPTRLFQVRTAGIRRPYLTHYVASADGRRFLVNAATGDPAPPMVSVLVNWTNLIRR